MLPRRPLNPLPKKTSGFIVDSFTHDHLGFDRSNYQSPSWRSTNPRWRDTKTKKPRQLVHRSIFPCHPPPLSLPTPGPASGVTITKLSLFECSPSAHQSGRDSQWWREPGQPRRPSVRRIRPTVSVYPPYLTADSRRPCSAPLFPGSSGRLSVRVPIHAGS